MKENLKKSIKKAIPVFSLIFIVIGAILIIALNNDDKASLYEEFNGFYFDTYISVKLYYNDEDAYNYHAEHEGVSLKEYIDETLTNIEDICKKYHTLTDRYSETSDVSKINTERTFQPDYDTYELIQAGLYYSELTEGAFDITLGTVTKGFSVSDRTIYDEAAAGSLLKDINYKNVDAVMSVTMNGDYYSKITLSGDNTYIDLGGIVKGYVADEICEYLKNRGFSNALINLGGNIVTMGKKSTSDEYIIGIQKPFADTGENIAAIRIVNSTDDKTSATSVVTSGIYERYFEKDGKLYHHIFDPGTGMPVENNLYSVTVISDNSTLADCLSTALFIMGTEKGLELVNSLKNTECIFIDENYSFIYSDGLTFEKNTFSLK